MNTLDTITKFFSFANGDYIGEPISQIEHGLQCAYFADQAGHSDEVVIASLLHDIGHFASESQQPTMSDLGVVQHEWIGAMLAYSINLSPKIALLIGYHVEAKRYLAAKKPAYYQRLSEASRKTLTFQGGPMKQDEMLAFEQLPYFKEILQVRVNDEKAKVVNLSVPDLAFYFPRIEKFTQADNVAQYKNFSIKDHVKIHEIEEFKASISF